ncbi:hypothetical protein FDP41_011131 [Naegleria fowleri]|uniref:acylphosphatase n=1 Tax=Naegleria fowleri TaxID=5763 RepID=A0A6A5BYE4_NAEFO|nr:uncharacterized protein FDP41_011131 [Naegleria fowleri]KAF0983153.1 hypothetical protein FDP41_011131 [Naegleria fowleri]
MTNFVCKGFRAVGKCQGVMFRQTVVRGMSNHGIKGGASNDKNNENLVWITMEGDEDKINEFAKKLINTKPLNSWGAQLESLSEVPKNEIIALEKHQVTTNNVDTFKWKKNVEFYLK